MRLCEYSTYFRAKTIILFLGHSFMAVSLSIAFFENFKTRLRDFELYDGDLWPLSTLVELVFIQPTWFHCLTLDCFGVLLSLWIIFDIWLFFKTASYRMKKENVHVYHQSIHHLNFYSGIPCMVIYDIHQMISESNFLTTTNLFMIIMSFFLTAMWLLVFRVYMSIRKETGMNPFVSEELQMESQSV